MLRFILFCGVLDSTHSGENMYSMMKPGGPGGMPGVSSSVSIEIDSFQPLVLMLS